MTKPIIKYYENGNKSIEKYIVNGQLHCDPSEGPVAIWYYNNGEIEEKSYHINNKLHRDPEIGPACISYHENGQVIRKEYWFNNKLHNPYGPAIIDYRDNVCEWWFNGIEHTNEVNEYLNINNLKYNNMTHTDFDIMWMNIL